MMLGSILGHLALVAAATFAGAAVYVSFAEHPARMQLETPAALTQWKPSYAAATQMQASLAVAGCLLGLLAWFVSGDWHWAVGAVLMGANLPYTLLVIMPVNHSLKATPMAEAGSSTRTLLQSWARLHLVRDGLSVAATAAFVWAAL